MDETLMQASKYDFIPSTCESPFIIRLNIVKQPLELDVSPTVIKMYVLDKAEKAISGYLLTWIMFSHHIDSTCIQL